jgi:hypothetical protein
LIADFIWKSPCERYCTATAKARSVPIEQKCRKSLLYMIILQLGWSIWCNYRHHYGYFLIVYYNMTIYCSCSVCEYLNREASWLPKTVPQSLCDFSRNFCWYVWQ